MQSDEKAASHKEKDKASAPAQETAASATPSAAPPTAGMATPRNAGGLTRQGSSRAGGTPKAKDTPKTAFKGNTKGSKKTVPASFVEVIDCLVDVTLRYKGMQPGDESDLADPVPEAMELEEPFSISAQLPDGRMVRVSASQPARAAGAGASAASGPGQGRPAANVSFTEQVRPKPEVVAGVMLAALCKPTPKHDPHITRNYIEKLYRKQRATAHVCTSCCHPLCCVQDQSVLASQLQMSCQICVFSWVSA